MKEMTIRLYDYDELSEEAKKAALEEWESEGVEHFCGGEIKDTLEGLEKELGIEVTRWEYSSYSHDIGVIRFKDYSDDQLALSGIRAQAFLWNNFAHLVVQPRKKWYARNRDGRVDYSGCLYCSDGWKNMYRTSKVFFSRTYDGTCPLTGVCFDNDALGPLAHFCLGVEWSDAERKRVMIPQPKRRMWSATTVEDVIRDCVDSLFQAAQDDWNSQFTEDYFADHARVNGFTFDENGHRR